jgi:hypothetical protein
VQHRWCANQPEKSGGLSAARRVDALASALPEMPENRDPAQLRSATVGECPRTATSAFQPFSAIPYSFCARAQAKWRRNDQRIASTPRFLGDVAVAILALVFSILFIVYSRNTGHSFWTYWAPFLLAGVAIPVYRAARSHMTEPEPVPAYPAGPAER